MFEQKKTKQDEQKIVSSSISSPEVGENDPLEPLTLTTLPLYKRVVVYGVYKFFNPFLVSHT